MRSEGRGAEQPFVEKAAVIGLYVQRLKIFRLKIERDSISLNSEGFPKAKEVRPWARYLRESTLLL
jgi:hypothetical protein